MKRSAIAWCLLAVSVTVLLLFPLVPRHYSVPLQEQRTGIRYWQLSTGSRIAYTLVPARGIKQPYPVIYLHGGPGGPVSNRNIELLGKLAEDGYDVYLYDQVGGGYSARLEHIRDYTAQRHLQDLEAIVSRIGAGKIILIGQSWGAMLAALFVAAHPDQTEKVIFNCPGPIPPVHPERALVKSPDSFQLSPPVFSNAIANRKATNLRMRAVRFWAEHFGWKLAADAEADAFYTYLSSLTNKSMVCDTTRARPAVGGGGFYVQVMTLQSLKHLPDPRPALRVSPVPVLVLKGQCDNQKWGFTSEYLELFPHHQLVVIPGAGHGIAIEQPELFLATIRDFLKQ